MTNDPSNLILVVSVAIGGVEVLRLVLRWFLDALPMVNLAVVVPLAVRLGMVALLAVRAVEVVKDLHHAVDATSIIYQGWTMVR